jgi:Flp pilus assembly protein TadG
MSFAHLHLRTDERGQSLVEMAFILPVLVLLLIGIVNFGWFAYSYIELTNAANAGVHYASMSVINASNTSGILAAMTSDAGNLTSINPTTALTCLCSDGSVATSCTSYSACVTDGDYLIDTVTVTAQTTVKPVVKFPGIPNSLTMHQSATMVVMQ